MSRLALAPLFLAALVGCSSSGNAPPPSGDSAFIDDDTGPAADAVARDSAAGDGSAEATTDAASDGADAPSGDTMFPDIGGDVWVIEDDTGSSEETSAPSGVCKPTTPWGLGTLVPSASTAGDDWLGTITADELSIAWTEGGTAIHWADRDNPSIPFGGAGTLSSAITFAATERVALSADGLRLVLVDATKKKLFELVRSSRAVGFSGTPTETPFAALTAGLASGEAIGDPVLSPDDKLLFYSKYSASSTVTIFFAARATTGAAWAPIGSIDVAKLDASSGKRRRPTGLSSDARALFYWDEADGVGAIAFRPTVASPFDTFVAVGVKRSPQTNLTCTRLYHSAGTPGDVFYSLPH